MIKDNTVLCFRDEGPCGLLVGNKTTDAMKKVFTDIELPWGMGNFDVERRVGRRSRRLEADNTRRHLYLAVPGGLSVLAQRLKTGFARTVQRNLHDNLIRPQGWEGLGTI